MSDESVVSGELDFPFSIYHFSELLESEFASVFEKGEIHRIEHETTIANGEVKFSFLS
jgi:hypothetical protein